MFQGTGVPLLSQEGNTRFPYLLQVLLPRFDPGVRIALACTLDLQVVFVEFNNASSLQAGVPHHLFELPPRIRAPERRFNMVSHPVTVPRAVLFDAFCHLEPSGPLEISNQKSAFRLQHAIHFTEHDNRIVETVQHRIGNNEIEVSRL